MEISEFSARTEPGYVRLNELKAFDETKAGFKGLVDSGVVKVPPIFVRPPEDLKKELLIPNGNSLFEVPIIDFKGLEKEDKRKEIVDGILGALENWGFFQLVNHGVPVTIMEEMIEGTRRFYDQDTEIKKQYFTRELTRTVRYNSNFDLYKTRAASWRDTLTCNVVAPNPLRPNELPDTCRDIILDYTKHVTSLGDTIIELLSEALGLKPNYLKSMDCTRWCTLTSHYYPPCPEPELTMGTGRHSDPAFLTVVLQDTIGGLQVLHQNHWVDVLPVPGALVVNIGDLLQVCIMTHLSAMTKSAEHRVLASRIGPRISIACFFSTTIDPSTRLYGPIKELLSEDNPPIYKEIRMKEFVGYFYTTGLDGIRPLTYFKL